MVKVVSSELEKVLVEQYHCHGLSTVIQSYFDPVSLRELAKPTLITYGSPGYIAGTTKNTSG